MDSARELGDDLIALFASVNPEKGSVSFGCFCAPGAVAKGANAGQIVKAAAQASGGNGGGRPDSAMAGGRDVSKLDEALAAAKAKAAELLG